MPYPRITNRPHLDMSIALNRSVKALLDADPDLVHLSGGPGGLQLLRRVEVPVVFTAHHTFRQAHRRPSARRAYGAIEARSYARAAAVAAVSRSTADALLAMGVRHEKVVVISPGVRLDHAGLDGRERQPGRMLFVGRLEPEKRPLDAITAMMDVARSVPGARGYVVGAGSMSSAVATAAGDTSGRVTFRGRLTDDEIAEEYRRAQVVLMPSDYEGLGIVALEATAAGAVVVGYDVDGLHDAIGASECLVPHGDVCALASTTRRVMTDSSLREDIVHRCLETIRNGRSWEGCARDFEHLYRNLLVA